MRVDCNSACAEKRDPLELSMATDYAGDTGNAEPSLRKIAQAGFKHIQWIHHWRHDFIYTEPEIAYIAALLDELDLSLYDIHAPAGAEKNWYSTVEYQRLAGVDIIKNRVDMCVNLGGSVIVAHIPDLQRENPGSWEQLIRSLDALEDYCGHRGVRIAVENRPHDSFEGIHELLDRYEADFVGLCYDSGHGNIGGNGLAHLASVKARLISIHLHDNDGLTDRHDPLFSGTVDWQLLARIIAESPYNAFLTIETEMRYEEEHEEMEFLTDAHRDGLKLLAML